MERMASRVSVWLRYFSSELYCILKQMMSSLRDAATLGSNCRMEPAAALRGLASNGSPFSSRCAFSSSNTALDI